MKAIEKKLRKTILTLSHTCQDGNLQSAFSSVDVIWVLYDKIMRWTPEIAADYNRDIFIISKGQATLALYAVLIEKGMFSMDDATDIGGLNSKFCIQADLTKFPDGGIENAAGSLGHGLPFAVGIALANKIRRSPSRVFVLTGDGEFCEGTMWEACLLAASKGLDNLCVIVDDNNSIGAMLNMGSLKDKLGSFGFTVEEINGHCAKEIEATLSRSADAGKPRAVISRTVRGYGSATISQNDVWFHKAPDKSNFDMLMAEIDAN